MELIKYKIKDLITVIDERNNLGIKSFYGININKEFMPTAANTNGLDESKYKIVRKNTFVFSGMQTGRDECIRISMYSKNDPILVSPAYTTFKITAINKILPMYFFMYFLSSEKDRLGAFLSDGSVRSNLDWEVFCNIELSLPSIEIQKKYVNIYSSMLMNQQCYEMGLEDLKLSYEALIDEYKYKADRKKIGDILKEIDYRNVDNSIIDVQGININKEFMPSVANIYNVDLTKYKIVRKGQFAFSGMQTGRDECIRIALHNKEKDIIISPAYTVLEMEDKTILPEYVMMWFSRKEIDRLGAFLSDGSIRTNLDKDRFDEIEIPVPKLEIQKAIVKIYNAYNMRREISQKLKTQIQKICPILIKGSIEEALQIKEA